MEDFTFDTFDELLNFLNTIDADTPLPRVTYLGYPHIFYDTVTQEYVYPVTIEIVTAPNGHESVAWYRGKATQYADEDFDFLGEVRPYGFQGS